MNNDINLRKIISEYDKNLLSEKRTRTGLRAEELREKLDPQQLVESLLSLAEEARTCPLDDLVRLKFQADICTTVLKKCMPDLRSLEVKDKALNVTTLVIDMVSQVTDVNVENAHGNNSSYNQITDES